MLYVASRKTYSRAEPSRSARRRRGFQFPWWRCFHTPGPASSLCPVPMPGPSSLHLPPTAGRCGLGKGLNLVLAVPFLSGPAFDAPPRNHGRESISCRSQGLSLRRRRHLASAPDGRSGRRDCSQLQREGRGGKSIKRKAGGVYPGGVLCNTHTSVPRAQSVP